MSYRKFHKNFLAFEPNFKFSTQTFTLSLNNLHEKDLKELKNFFESLTESISNYSKWNVFLTTLDKIKQLQLDSFLKFVQDNHATLDIANTYRKSFYHSWAKYLIDKNKLTSSFHKENHEDKIHRFIQLDQEILLHNRSRVREAVYANKPNAHAENLAPSSEQAILSKEFAKKRKKFSVRKLFQAIPNLIKEIKPVIMMSPITVANFLKMGDFKFDVLIFDEASQIFPYDAIGSLARAEQVIIAGDREQLPPTNFFLTGSDTDVLDIDDENEEDFTATDSTEFESILDLANSRLRNISLMWHYRSRNEGLIAFSNKEIYLNKLITFPSINDGIKHDGVEFILVENGIYERGKSKTNRQEADKIIELIIQHIKEHPDRSLGVVTINSNQQELIENLLLKRMQGNSKLERFISGETHPKESFFIKNIESVQGDERDTIIFGIGYGRDSTGQFKMIFGPINHLGGERRLNVAITRAKINMKVIASVRGNDFKITEKTPRGVKLLSDYLAYAEKGAYPFSTNSLSNEENERNFEEEVARFLEKKGFLIERKVGVSSFKIDIAIRHPNRPKVYILGIECDGDTYVAGKTVRDRDALRQLVLERLGWKIYRVWSTDWFKFPLAAQEKLMETINRIIEGKDSNTPTIDSLKKKQELTNPIQEEIKVKESKLSFHEYEVADADVKKLNSLHGYIYDQDNHQGFIKIFNAILEKESPVHISRFYELMKPYYDRNVMTVFIKNAFDYQLKLTKSKELKPFMMVDDIFIKSEQKEFPFRNKKGFMRPIKTVYFFELIEGMKTIVNHYKVISKTHLIEQLYLACNYPPYGKKDLDVFANLVNEAVQMKYLVEDNSVIKLGEKSI
jgi:very-short-patch-repair endonuclease